MKFSHVLFAGPSLSDVEQLRHLNYLDIRPPATAGDIINYITDNPYLEVLILADGLFFSKYAPLHRELQLALKSLVRVIGCSSLGALRAVELADEGMHGYGTIYRYFTVHKQTPDDEVCLLHSDSTEGFKPLTVPLINLRLLYNKTRCKRLRRILVRLIPELEIVPFHQRSWDLIRNILTRECIDGLDEFQYLRAKYVDYKQKDLSSLLQSLPIKAPKLSGLARFKQLNLDAARNDIASGEYRASTYAMAPFRSLCHLSNESSLSELDLRDLYLLFNLAQPLVRHLVLNELLIKESLASGLSITWPEIEQMANDLLAIYQSTDIYYLCTIYRLCLYEFFCFLYLQCLLRSAEESVATNLLRGINIEALSTTLRSQSRLPSQPYGLGLDKLQRLKSISMQLRNPSKRNLVLQLITAGLLTHDIKEVDPDPSLGRTAVRSSVRIEDHEYSELLVRLSMSQRWDA